MFAFFESQGCLHDKGQHGACSTSNYNYGYRDPSGDFRSILAYNCNNNGCAGDTLKSCTRVQRFSNIASNYNGKAIGTSQINNARRINEIKGTIANYYPPAPTPPPTPSPTPSPPSPSSCMSGDTRVNTATSNEASEYMHVRDLTVGDTIQGLDENMNPVTCSIEAIGHFGGEYCLHSCSEREMCYGSAYLLNS